MRIGITYLYNIVNGGYPPSMEADFKCFRKISDMGFHYLEMEGLGEGHFENVWRHRQEYKNAVDENGIHIHNFCIINANLVSLDRETRREAYEGIDRYFELGNFFETETFHLASYAPPLNYIGNAPYQLGVQEYRIEDRARMRVPDGFSWDEVWKVLVESCRYVSRAAARYGKTVLMEPRIGEVICSVDSMLRLVEAVDLPNFKANIDTGHFGAQRENVPLSLIKLKNKFANIHISDVDPRRTDHLAVGDGTIDWTEFFRLLKQMDYQGYLGLDLSLSDTLEEDLIRSRDYIIKLAREAGIQIEW